MAEYIEREELLEDIDAAVKNSGMGYIIGQVLKRYVKRQTAADVAPVRHGRWIFEPDGGTRCSECNKRVRDVTGGLNAPVNLCELPYCPKCGAKMDWKGGEAE